MTPCMGGWCNRREQCPHYWARGEQPVERLCIRGADGIRVIDVWPARIKAVEVSTGKEVPMP